MVDPIGAKPVAASDRRLIGAVNRVGQAQTIEGGTSPMRMSPLAQTARTMAATPPVDTERVARIRRAIREGNFPITPATVADRMLALKMNWKPDDAA